MARQRAMAGVMALAVLLILVLLVWY